jgi:hypothetical protein
MYTNTRMKPAITLSPADDPSVKVVSIPQGLKKKIEYVTGAGSVSLTVPLVIVLAVFLYKEGRLLWRDKQIFSLMTVLLFSDAN